ncbi:50S ribosomal protein L25 [Cohnella terricola]|uniref:Large ribosomal subunit protein bL25 n=1 Tax=Cohnella terricola TaxID=1289167 RepID=A0A559J7B4_9BACL|nr:50S ribosomal protein L25 [Cohnella terricola]TVX95789.1 50S ribosomal protein L25 [Cohnella terricola]
MSPMLQAQLREVSTKGDLRRIRSTGYVPGVVYGKGLSAPSAITVNAKDVEAMLRSHPYAVIDIDIPGTGRQPVMMSDLQRDPISRHVTHIDFHKINMNEKIATSARVDITGASPGEKEGGMLQLVLHEIDIECYPKDIPDAIAADVSGLGMGDHLTVGELKLPSGVTSTQDPETIVVAVLAPQKERSEDELDDMDVEVEENRKNRENAIAVEKD